MPAVNPIQTSFMAGEISPRLRGREDIKHYQYGLASCLNFNPTPQGSLLKAEGLRLVEAPTDNAGFARTISFKAADLTRLQVSLTDGRIRVFDEAGLLGAFTVDYIFNGGCDTGGGGWTFSSSSVVRTGFYGEAPDQYIGLFSDDGDVWAKPAAISIPAGTYTLKFRTRNFTGVTPPSTKLTVLIGTADNGSQIASKTVDGVGTFSVNFTLAGTTTVYFKFVHPIQTGMYAAFDDVSVRAQTATMYAAAPWLAADIPEVQYVAETGRDRLILVHEFYEPRVLSRDKSTGIWTLQRMFTDLGGVKPTKPPAHTVGDFEWTGNGNPYAGGNGDWPAVVEHWQGRIWLARTRLKRNTFWASKPFSYDFTASNYQALTAGDGFSYDAATKGEIRWLQGQKVMLCGTDGGEFSFSASDGVVYAGNIDIKQESAYGSSRLQALSIGDQVLYVSPDRKKLRAMSFSLEGGGWFSRDITFTAEHITQSTIVEAAFARDPFNTIVLCLSDGTLACCNYSRAEGVAGWWRREFAGALAKSVAVMETADGSEVWVVAEITASAPYRFLARWPLYETLKPKIDCQRTLNSTLIAPSGTLALNHTTLVATASSANVFSASTLHAVPGTEIRITGGGWYGVIRITALLGTYTAQFEVIDDYPLTEDLAATDQWQYDTALLQFGHNWWNGVGMYSYPLFSSSTRVVVVDQDGDTLAVLPWGGSATVLDNPTDGYSVAVKRHVDYTLVEGTYTVGVAFTAEAETLPLVVGNPAGSAQGLNAHRASITVRLSDSCLPKLNGAAAEPPVNRFFGVGADPLLYLRMAGDRFTEDATAKPQSRSRGGIVAITQELPWRTEVCALFGGSQMSQI
jgi:hypothetical protein